MWEKKQGTRTLSDFTASNCVCCTLISCCWFASPKVKTWKYMFCLLCTEVWEKTTAEELINRIATMCLWTLGNLERKTIQIHYNATEIQAVREWRSGKVWYFFLLFSTTTNFQAGWKQKHLSSWGSGIIYVHKAFCELRGRRSSTSRLYLICDKLGYAIQFADLYV